MTLNQDEDQLLGDLREAFGVGTLGIAGSAVRIGAGAGPQRGSSAAAAQLDATTLSPGSLIGDFEIMGEIGRGGMGVVYRARQTSLKRLVALKILPGAAWRGGTAIQRFRREAQAAACLNHANIVPVYAQGESEGSYYYAMKLVEGVSLDTAIKSQPHLLSSKSAFKPGSSVIAVDDLHVSDSQKAPSAADAAGIVDSEPTPVRRTMDDYRNIASMLAGVADGLAHAHQNGVLHRDIKPHNLILGDQQRLYITDFGLACFTAEPHLTVTGELMGTPVYLSPEQIRGNPAEIDHRADIYSLGVTLYEVITGQRPFDGENRDQILHAICNAEPKSPRLVDSRVPRDLETICLRAIEKEASRRFQTAAALADDLRRFAEGRPILSRRASMLEKTTKWVRRHKAVTVALTAAATALAVSAAWAVSVAAARQREAAQLVDGAYEQLVYLDYHKPERITPDIQRAEALGGSSDKLLFVEALAALGRYDQDAALEYLDPLLDDDSAMTQAWYMAAWAHWRKGDHVLSREAFQHAEDSGGPQTSEGWFFRGLAAHFDDHEVAIESYRQANLQRAQQGLFFPQAVLHLARAHNQQMYATRTIDSLDEAESSLRQLVDNRHYQSYPYYLLSITYRLAAEIYEGSDGARDGQAEEYFAEALSWALEGQEVDPTNDRPVTAQAECLEQQGLIDEAIAARSRAIELARKDGARCEGYHYRWRLHYWRGNLDEALRDIELHAECVPDSPYYAHVYPALVLAELGDLPGAIAKAQAISEAAPADAGMVLLSATCLRLLGQGPQALELLLDSLDAVDFDSGVDLTHSEEWMRALYAYAANLEPFDSLRQIADDTESPWKLLGEAHFHAGAKAVAQGKRNSAINHFFDAYRSFDGALNFTFHGRMVAEKMKADPNWPGWITWNRTSAGDDETSVRLPVGVQSLTD